MLDISAEDDARTLRKAMASQGSFEGSARLFALLGGWICPMRFMGEVLEKDKICLSIW
jgi:hypothetical protein